MNKSEIAIQVRAEKIQLEHEALMQEMNAVLVSLIGLPLAWVTFVYYLGLTSQICNPIVVLVLALLLGIFEYLREMKNQQLEDKRDELETLLSSWTV